MKFRKKPVAIEAIQNNTREDAKKMSREWGENFENQVQFDEDNDEIIHSIFTPFGVSLVERGDWIINIGDGQFDTCEPDIFEKTYEKVD